MRATWPELRRALVLHVQSFRVIFFDLRARAALASAAASAQGSARAGHLVQASEDARRLEREKRPWTVALGTLIDAGVASGRGERELAVSLYGRAAVELDSVDMAGHAHVARLRQGELVAGAEGQAMVAAARGWLLGQTVKNPERWAAMFAPRLA
jgi:hypothetical protein